ncbi:hypothetical protein JHK87_020363 [Glycine soja]|nr:hypothetical protein JHK87_020363 [Glycine soja]
MATTDEEVPTQFPARLRVLAIDNDSTVLETVKQMCNECHHQVITYSNALHALDRVREDRYCVDVILIDVNMPNMDGHEFLQRIRMEIDVPVIVMSLDDSTSTKMQAIKHGACDYWKKPLHEDQFRNMWMHVARKAWNANRVDMKPGSLEEKPQANKGKSRVIWAEEERHIKFLDAAEQLGGIDKAAPKRILEVMKDPGLTREQVASHLQKVRHQEKKKKNNSDEVRKSLPNTFQLTTTESSVSAYGKIERQAFAVNGLVPCKTHTGIGTELTSDLMPKEEQWHAKQGMTYDHPALSICPPPHILNHHQSMMNVDEESGYGVWSPSAIHDTMRLRQVQEQEQQQMQMNFQSPCIFHDYTTTPASASASASSIPEQVQGGYFSVPNTLISPYSSRSDDSIHEESPENFGYDDESSSN